MLGKIYLHYPFTSFILFHYSLFRSRTLYLKRTPITLTEKTFFCDTLTFDFVI